MTRAGDGHVTRVDKSAVTGTLIVCTCGAVLGPMLDHAATVRIAKEHRALHRPTT